MKPFDVLTAVATRLPRSDVDAFVRDASARRHAQIVVAERNLGRDPAPGRAAALLAEHGVRCVISSHALDAFAESCVSRGILPITLPPGQVRLLLGDAANPESALMTIDLPRQEIVRAGGIVLTFEVERHVKERLLLGAT